MQARLSPLPYSLLLGIFSLGGFFRGFSSLRRRWRLLRFLLLLFRSFARRANVDDLVKHIEPERCAKRNSYGRKQQAKDLLYPPSPINRICAWWIAGVLDARFSFRPSDRNPKLLDLLPVVIQLFLNLCCALLCCLLGCFGI